MEGHAEFFGGVVDAVAARGAVVTADVVEAVGADAIAVEDAEGEGAWGFVEEDGEMAEEGLADAAAGLGGGCAIAFEYGEVEGGGAGGGVDGAEGGGGGVSEEEDLFFVGGEWGLSDGGEDFGIVEDVVEGGVEVIRGGTWAWGEDESAAWGGGGGEGGGEQEGGEGEEWGFHGGIDGTVGG